MVIVLRLDSLVPAVSKAAIAAGADGLILEVHPQPERALKEGVQSLRFDAFSRLMNEIALITEAVGRTLESGRKADQNVGIGYVTQGF